MQTGGPCTTQRREPCQAGNRAALSGVAACDAGKSVRLYIRVHGPQKFCGCLAF
ncbi:protein of unknown function [Ruminococcaceae bacterium BL-4]|nr:protein of unknown function [Ruminococcaceae bacterium BL-4]